MEKNTQGKVHYKQAQNQRIVMCIRVFGGSTNYMGNSKYFVKFVDDYSR